MAASSTTAQAAPAASCTRRPTPAPPSQAFWKVEDIESEVAELKARGVVFEDYDMPGKDKNGIVNQGGAKAAWFTDTEGNIMAVIQGV